MTPAPRILVVSADQWPRALVRAELRDAGYDAIGATTLCRALRHPSSDIERGSVRLILVDDRATAAEPGVLEHVRRRYPGVLLALIHRAGAAPSARWDATFQRPVAIGDIVATVRRLVPLPPS